MAFGKRISEERSFALRFTMPLIFENMFVSGLGLVFSAIVGNISKSSLAAMGTGTQILNFIIAVFSAITTGSAILCARLTGRHDREGASHVVEQVLFLAPVSSIAMMLVLLLTSVPVTRLLMPGAEEAFFNEGLTYYRMVLYSLPALITFNALMGVLRAVGESRLAMLSSVVMTAVQLTSAYVFVNLWNMQVAGAGLAYVVCRYVGAAIAVAEVLRHRRSFYVNAQRVLHPDRATCMRMLRVGAPNSIDSLAVQSGYLIINTMLIGLGEFAASVYNVLSTLTGLAGICQSVGNCASTTMVGQRIGAGDVKGARRSYVRILLLSLLASNVVCGFIVIFSTTSASFFSKGEVMVSSAALMWNLIPYNIPALGVNVCEPAARVGGYGKSVMVSCCLCVWLIRLPLTYLFCYPLQMSVTGVYLANAVSLLARALCAMVMIGRKKWGLREL